MKIALISSPGGHLYKTLQLKKWWSQYNRFWVTNKCEIITDKSIKNKFVYIAYFPENRNTLNAIRNFFLALRILCKEKPELIFSMGAGIAPPFFLAAKLLWLFNIKIKTIFIETFIFIPKPTLSGKMIYFLRLADLFVVQNKKLLKFYPKAKYLGPIL